MFVEETEATEFNTKSRSKRSTTKDLDGLAHDIGRDGRPKISTIQLAVSVRSPFTSFLRVNSVSSVTSVFAFVFS
jgi:hypothetical protein